MLTLQKKSAAIALFAAFSVALAGCTSSGANRVSTSAVGESITVRQGTVISVREVVIQPDNSIVGAGTGAVLGGIAGSEIGGGDKANTAGAVAGAVLGGIAGNIIGQRAQTRDGLAITIDFGDGKQKAFIQNRDLIVRPGETVNVEFRNDGAYVVPIYGNATS